MNRQTPTGGAPARATPARTVTRVLARPVFHEGVLRRPGETVTLPRDVAAVLEPEGQFEPAPAGKEV